MAARDICNMDFDLGQVKDQHLPAQSPSTSREDSAQLGD